MSNAEHNFDFDDFASRLRQSDVNCNCSWINCPIHKGGLCSNKAVYIKCGNPECEQDHYLGDGSIAPGVAICVDCSTHLIDLFKETVTKVMRDLWPYIPNWMKLLNRLIRDAYMAKFEAGWETPQLDAMGVMTFASLIIMIDSKFGDKSNRIPASLVAETLKVILLIKEITLAYNVDKLGVLDENAVAPVENKVDPSGV